MKTGERNQLIGALGEEEAVRLLQMMGYRIIERNWKCNFGEADIIAIEDGELVFIEVKTRTSNKSGFGSEAVTAKKRRKYERIATCYIDSHRVGDMFVRFDVVELLPCAFEQMFNRVIKNAWEVGE